MTRSAGSASSLKVNAWLSRGKRNSPLLLDPIQHFASGKSQIFTELEMWDTFDSPTPGSFVHPGRWDSQECGNLFYGGQIAVVDPLWIVGCAFLMGRDHFRVTDGVTGRSMCVYALLTDSRRS